MCNEIDIISNWQELLTCTCLWSNDGLVEAPENVLPCLTMMDNVKGFGKGLVL